MKINFYFGRAINRTTTSEPVSSRAILRRTRPNATCIIARQLPKYFLTLHETAPGLSESGLQDFAYPSVRIADLRGGHGLRGF